MAYPHSFAETIADGAVHATGLAFAVLASVVLLYQIGDADVPLVPAVLYCGCMVLAFSASAAYHLSPIDALRPLLNRIDHAAIYFKIAGTYTPLVALLGTASAYAVLGVIWALATVGAVAKLWFWRTDGRGSLALYLGMGWFSVLLIWPMWQRLPGQAMTLVVLGGLIYSLGTIVFSREAMRFQNAIWHSFVLTASVCFFLAIFLSL